MDARLGQPAIDAALRELPAVDGLLRQPIFASLLEKFSREEVLRCVRAALDECRLRIRTAQPAQTSPAALALRVRQLLHERTRPGLRRVINATGIVLHTGLGRAPLAQEALEAIAEAAAGYCNLETDLADGTRGDRHVHVRDLLCELTGAADALVVNNNAAATYLALHALAAGREAILSRGQLVEIGGSYRMPDIIAAAGCRMIEVGTTNRTRLRDYERAIRAETALLLYVHTSNYRIEGFTETPQLSAMVELARHQRTADGLLVVHDLGSGLLDRIVSPVGTELGWDEPTVRESIAAGADLTLFSGDKLLGGPQAGIIVGRADLITRLRSDPIMRTVRPDKLALAGLEATLRLYRDPTALLERVPVLRMLAASADDLEPVARRLATDVARCLPDASAECVSECSLVGGGALPTLKLPTWCVRVRHPSLTPNQLAAALRQRELPVFARIHQDGLLFDCRTLSAADAEAIALEMSDVARTAVLDAG